MHRIALGLSAFLLVAAISSPGATQQLDAAVAASNGPDCGYVCIFAASVAVNEDLERQAPVRGRSAEAVPVSSDPSAVAVSDRRAPSSSRF